jgi:hypothetical protein
MNKDELKKEKKKMRDVINKDNYINSLNNLLIYTDIYDKYEAPYENDPSIDNMYQRKSKRKLVKIDSTKPINIKLPTKSETIGDIGKLLSDNKDIIISIRKMMKPKTK